MMITAATMCSHFAMPAEQVHATHIMPIVRLVLIKRPIVFVGGHVVASSILIVVT
jgi:hypothetical protein